MTHPGFEDDATSVVDEVLLAEIRAEMARRSQAGGGGEPAEHSAGRSPPHPGGDLAAVGHDADDETPVVERYGALREIGRGGFSRVYEALQFDFERWVAVKVLNKALDGEEEAAEFERECRLMGVLSRHPNIVTVLESTFTDSGVPCIVMELYPSGSYLDVLQAAGPLGMEELLSVAVTISGALATAHRQGVIHGDVKPQNIFRSEYGAALGDFGIASLINHGYGPAKTRLSLYYAAPEVIERGEAALSPFSDQYSLAATLYTLATGERPFHTSDGGSTREFLLDALTAPVPRLGNEFPATLDQALQRAMTREPALRHRDMRAFATAIGEVEAELGFRPTEMRVLTGSGRYAAQVPGQSSRDLSSSGEMSPAPASYGRVSATGPRRRTESLERPGEHGNTTIVRPSQPVTGPRPDTLTDTGQHTSELGGRPPARSRTRWARLAGVAALIAAVSVAAVVLLADGDDGVEAPVPPAADGGAEVPVPPAGDGDDGGVEPPVPAPDDADARAAETPGSIRVEGQHNELVVSWGGPVEGAPPILFYRVQWREPGTAFSEEREMLVASDQTGARIFSLASDAEYEVRVAAENEHGRGDWTEASGATLPVGVPAPPTLQIDPIDGGVAVKWGEPSDGGWPITAYVVEWEDSSGRIDYQRYAAGTTEAVIPDLDGGETYRVRVFAENENGRGGWAEDTAVVAVPVPETPAGVAVAAFHHMLHVSWEESSVSSGRWPVTGYVLEYYDADNTSIGGQSVGPDERRAEIAGLVSGTSYEVRLFAVNEGGFSEPAVAWGAPLHRIAFVSDYEGRDAIYYMDVSVESDAVTVAEFVRVTDSDTRQREGSPSWSPDGSWIAFHRRHPENSHWQIFVKNIQSGEERQLVCGRDNGWSPTWSPDGSLIAYARGDRGNDLWAINVETGETRSLKDKYDADDAYPSWSPDGDMIVFARRDHDPRWSNRYNSRNPREIRVLTGVSTDAADLGVTWLTSSYAEGHYTSPEWSPGGDRIAYSASLSGSAELHIAVMDQAGNALQQLTSEHHDDDPTWSPDGEWVAFARGSDGARSIYVISSSGGEPEQLLGFPENDYWAPSWAPAGDVSVDPAYDCRS